MMLCKLAFRNVKKSIRDYAIYFLTLTFGVCIFYVFNSIESQHVMIDINESQMRALQAINKMMGVVSVFISVIFGFLILYANQFLVKRRKKELGIYMTLGMEKRSVTRILMIETIFVGGFSLLSGLALGAFLSQGLALITAKLFEAKLKQFQFVFSPMAFNKAILYFGIAFFLIIIFNTFTISRRKLMDLIYANCKNENFKTPRLALSVFLFAISLLCLGIAYVLIINNGIIRINSEWINNKFWTSIILGCVGTFLFFFSLSGFFVKLIQQSKKIYLKNLNLFVLRQINNKINSTYISMTFVCLMLFVSICTLSTGIGMASQITKEIKKGTPFDATVTIYVESQQTSFDMLKSLEKKGVELDSFAKEYLLVKWYNPKIQFEIHREGDVPVIFEPYFIKLSEYNNVLKLQGIEPISLAKDEYAINSREDELGKNGIKEYMIRINSIKVGKTVLKTNPMKFYENAMETSRHGNGDTTIVVSDEVLENVPLILNQLHLNYIESTENYEKICKSEFGKVNYNDEYLHTRIEALETSRITSTVIAYLSIYIGIVFLIMSAAILAIAQLSEASDNIIRYGLLRKIGTEDRMINKALFVQIFIYFGVPMFLALIHSWIGMIVVNDATKVSTSNDIFENSVFVAVAFLIVYGGYFLATYLGSKNIVNRG